MAAKIRAYKLAEELGIERHEFVEKALRIGIELKSAMAALDDERGRRDLREKLGGVVSAPTGRTWTSSASSVKGASTVIAPAAQAGEGRRRPAGGGRPALGRGEAVDVFHGGRCRCTRSRPSPEEPAVDERGCHGGGGRPSDSRLPWWRRGRRRRCRRRPPESAPAEIVAASQGFAESGRAALRRRSSRIARASSASACARWSTCRSRSSSDRQIGSRRRHSVAPGHVARAQIVNPRSRVATSSAGRSREAAAEQKSRDQGPGRDQCGRAGQAAGGQGSRSSRAS